MTKVRNVHERHVQASAQVVGALVDRLSSDDDPVFPAPAWAPIRLDRPLGVGADGGHGPVRYTVVAYEPGRRIRFAFSPPDNGFHELTVEPVGEDRCVVRHVLEQDQRGVARIAWLTAVRAVHGTVIEELFDNIERAATGTVARPVRWSPRVALLNRLDWDKPVAVEIPATARLIRTALERPDFRDAWQMDLLPGMPRDPRAWTGILRDSFPVIAQEGGELLLRVDTAGLRARASILVDEEAGHIVLSTVVKTGSLRGRLYWGAVERVHPFMARTMLRRAHRGLALAAPSAGARNRTVSLVEPGDGLPA
ncbi:DUF2867 domain-containing protein [Streptomyces sp. ISL-98]|uniref:DUF2867 domain-containing protein n=1 Tax=Streptomyces sp. ISL-98 TaxID=2819192 RepID=UPI001BE8E585|nr:DUF2867 domain-containing protein [Streptomyces sp. ISL-98]MBT2504658.1 DUF2867 domain-containing protein [Streptomyces sp. ISL-98]